jgi:hypothetical protein
MKSLRESILDIDDNIDNLEIPKKPSVSKKDYIYYLQAWYDVMYDILDGGETNFSKWVWVVKLFKTWDPIWTIYIGEEDNDILDLIELGDIEEAILKSTYKKGASEMKWSREIMDDIIKDFESGNSNGRMSIDGSNSILMALCGGDFESYNMIEHHAFSIGSKYDKYVSDITKALKIYGIKL